MKTLRIVIICLIVFGAIFHSSDSVAQCSMCTLNAENSVQNGNTEGNGLNRGILYLLAAPYIAIAAVGFLWYKKYRRKNVNINMKENKINLN
ncbi:hypothetical protein [Daejeonella sp.]|jgi:hypothetical protein|uniref:hypothetical protein n=1 Tax=Daejeonella sp. TaxID=2805397 RepID=UPI0037C08698